jgi:hypothetical protein
LVDVAVLIREHLLNQAEVTALLGTNLNGSIYCAADLPEHFDPKLGPAIQLVRSGGGSHDEITVLVNARVQVRVWADVEQYQLASNVYGAINDTLHGVTMVSLADGVILSALEATGPQEMSDPDTGWAAVNSFYAVMACPN